MSQNIRCRFAPSPTGYLHLGGARTALFNYLFAKAAGGTMVLRIEDTDLERSTDAAVEAIFQGLEWLRIRADEGPFFQSKRSELYAEYARKLLSSGHAYRCYATPAELDAMREEQKRRGENPRYDGRFRPATVTPQSTELPSPGNEKPFVIRFRAPQEGATVFHDLVLDDVRTPNEELEDFIIYRSDGSPTYNFVVVADDIEMRITHVIRGSDHVSNTPKQVALYNALGAPLPKFVHVPMILGEDKKKLSKRHGATSVIEYKTEGYLPDAFVNYLVRLGWGHGDQEIFSREELERIFNLENIGRSPAVFDFQKLRWVNGEHLKVIASDALFTELEPFLLERYPAHAQEIVRSNEALAKLIDTLRERSQTLREMAEGCSWFFAGDREIAIAPGDRAKRFHEKAVAGIGRLKAALESELAGHPSERLTEQRADALFHEVLEQAGLKFGELGPAVRLALTGTMASPSLAAVFEILGRERALRRLESVTA